MATEHDYQAFLDRVAALEETVADRLSSRLVTDPQLADVLVKQIDDLLQKAVDADMAVPPPPDKGLAQLVGVGPEAADRLGLTRIPQAITPYDETVSSERLIAMGDLYYIYQHERIGVFRAVQKLQEVFRAGAVYLSSGSGAYALYQFDRREVLRYTGREQAAYRRAFGYGRGAVPTGSRRTAISMACSGTSPTRSHCSGGTSGSLTSCGTGPTTRASVASPSCAGPAWTCATT